MNFEFATATRINFGAGKFADAASVVSALGQRPFLVTGRTARHVLPSAASFTVVGEPTFETVQSALAVGRENDCDVVVAIGGGSVIDTGKAVAMLLANGGDPLDYAEVIGSGRPIVQPSVPLVAIPTTAGTGSEVTRNAVLASPKHKAKVSLRSPLMLPAVALVDPELTYGLPPAVTAATGMDALSQLIEPFVSVRANPMTDALCREGITRAAGSLRRAFENGRDASAREDMALASLFSGLALANAGLGAVHGFAAAIGGMFDAPHGAVCAVMLGPVMRANARAVPVKMAEIERIIAVDEIEKLAADFGIPKLRAYGISEKDFPGLVDRAMLTSSMKGNPVALEREVLEEILWSAL